MFATDYGNGKRNCHNDHCVAREVHFEQGKFASMLGVDMSKRVQLSDVMCAFGNTAHGMVRATNTFSFFLIYRANGA